MRHEAIPGRLGWWATLRLGRRNLARNRRRTWITASTVAIAVFLLQISISLLAGLERQSFDNLINFQTGHAKIFAPGYFEERDELSLDYYLSDLEVLENRVEAVPGVDGATPRLTFSAQLSNGVDQIACLGVGILTAGSDTDVFRIPQAIVEGDYLDPEEEGILLGSGLADLFQASTDDWLTVLTKTRGGAYEALDLPIVGLLGTGNPLIDMNSFLLPLETAQYMLDMSGQATEMAVRFAANAGEPGTLRRLRSSMEGVSEVEVYGWREVEEDFLALVTMKRTGQTIFLSILVVLAVVGITNTILMATFERTKEIGMLMAMGLRSSGIRRLFLSEGVLTGLLGGSVGVLIAVAPIAYFASKGINLQALYGDMDLGYPVKDFMYPTLRFALLFGSIALTCALAAIAALYPAVRASRQDPVEALRHV
jgi:putative ABC transport system permease protein